MSCLVVRAFVLCLLTSCAAPSDVDVDSVSQEIVDGMPDTSTKNVLMVGRRDGALCSSSLITPDLVLTARHCVSAEVQSGVTTMCEGARAFTFDDIVSPDDLRVVTGSGISDALQHVHEVDKIYSLPDADMLPTCGNDIVVLRLSEPITDITPLAVKLDEMPVVDDVLSAVGFGATAPGANSTAGTRRRRDDVRVTHTERVMAGTQVVSVDGEIMTTAGPCGGDSGGPAINAQGEVVGVASRALSTGCQGIYESPTQHASWFRGLVVNSSQRLGTALPTWAEGEALMIDESEPDSGCDASHARHASWLVWIVAIALFALRRDRQVA